MQKKILSFLLAISILTGLYNFSAFPVFAEPERGTIRIAETMDGEPIDTVVVGETFTISVYLSNFPMLWDAIPSLHFDPNVVKVLDREGNITEEPRFGVTDFFTTGDALLVNQQNPAYWRGRVKTGVARYPFVNNTNGVLGIWFDIVNPRDLNHEQLLYTINFKAVGIGNPDIRLSSREDSIGRPEPSIHWYDWALYHGDTPRYVYFGGGRSDFEGFMPNVRVISKFHIETRLYYNGIPANGVLQPDKMLTILATIHNGYDNDADIMLIIAAYDQRGRMLESQVHRREIPARTIAELNLEYMPSALEVDNIKILIWNANTMAPYVPSVNLYKKLN